MYYNSTKGGVDTMDQLVRSYSTKRMTRRWPMAIFYNMVDVSALNALIVYLSLHQVTFESRARLTCRGLLIQWGSSWQVAKISNLAAPLLVSWMIAKIYHLALHKRNDVTSVQDRKTKILCVQCRKNVCTKHSAVVCCQCQSL